MTDQTPTQTENRHQSMPSWLRNGLIMGAVGLTVTIGVMLYV